MRHRAGEYRDEDRRDDYGQEEPGERAFAVAAWREAPYFIEAERATLALTAATRLSDRPDPAPDGVFEEAATTKNRPSRP